MKDAENLKVYPNFDTKFPESPLLQTFIAELAVPIPGKGEPFMAIGKGRNKGEAERMCCYAACEKLHEEGFLDKQGIVKLGHSEFEALSFWTCCFCQGLAFLP